MRVHAQHDSFHTRRIEETTNENNEHRTGRNAQDDTSRRQPRDARGLRQDLSLAGRRPHHCGTADARQSPTAIEAIEAFLASYGLSFSLPVQDIASCQDAQSFLSQAGLDPQSMEPQCHCADTGTTENANPASINADIALLTNGCHAFIERCLQERI